MRYEDVMRLALERGFYAPSCEIYSDAPAGFWDYGPLGVALRNRFIDLWRRELIRRDDMIEIDGSQIMSKSVFVASGHLESFADPIVSCMKCRLTLRVDRLISEKTGKIIPERMAVEDYDRLLKEHDVRCPRCGGGLGGVSMFNMMFKVRVGAGGEDAYLRPETCQSIFVDFPRLFKVMRGKLPFPVAQFGKSFRNEISPRQSLIRLREFYQAEIEVFFNPKYAIDAQKFEEVRDYRLKLALGEGVEEVSCIDAVERGLIPNRLISYYLALIQQFYEKAGVDMGRFRVRRLGEEEKAFYAETAFDVEVETSLGWIELVACNYRTDYDLKGHSRVSKEDMEVMDGGEKIIPHVFELSMGVDRSIYCIMEHAYHREDGRDVLKLKPALAPIQVGVFPLVNRDELPRKAREIYNSLKKDFQAFYDESGSIGRRYRRQDEIGVPVCVTVDYDTLRDDTVTLRDRDSMKQIRIDIPKLASRLNDLYRGEDALQL